MKLHKLFWEIEHLASFICEHIGLSVLIWVLAWLYESMTFYFTTALLWQVGQPKHLDSVTENTLNLKFKAI